MIDLARSFLFVPGDRPDRFAKALASGADAVILDLEDAVAPDRKALARAEVANWLATNGPAIVRVNASGSREFESDVAAIASHVAAVMLPKSERVEDIARVREISGGQLSVVALIETSKGVANASRIAQEDGVVRLALGNVDLAAELDIDPSDDMALMYVRSLLVLASAAAGLPGLIDGVSTEIQDLDRVAAAAAHGRRLGATAKLCIHPAQVDVVNLAMSPSKGDLQWARSVLSADGDGATAVGGHMVDPPVLARARRLLARHDALSS
ncbi:CoA ester lyase [Aeromicrobium sp. Leaf350]|uniref:HpcH/HpaI aldolase/citrate lyase family protein n=1 Tax=Aeromicrobium sp. Leaf350 TaxID=2876565 RepID=UPI001E5CD457|nr:CoA ester lyase [Aeromicrobium sp. Leaf350]